MKKVFTCKKVTSYKIHTLGTFCHFSRLTNISTLTCLRNLTFYFQLYRYVSWIRLECYKRTLVCKMLIKWLNIKRITGAGWLKSYYDAGHYTYYIAPVRVIHGLFAFLPLADGAPDLKSLHHS